MALSGNERTKRWQKLHPEFRERARVSRARNLEAIDKLKEGPCTDCRECYPTCVMDWDHVRGEKTTNVTRLRSANAPISRILEEIEKCDLVCANCHRMRTFLDADGNYLKSRAQNSRRRK